MERKEKVIELIGKLFDTFYDTPDRFFLALADIMIERNFSDKTIERMVESTIYKVKRTRLTVADVLEEPENEGKKYEYL